MDKNNNSKVIKWYNDANLISTLIIGCILVIILLGQSFAVGEGLSLIGSIINHNSTYFVLLIYFIFLNFRFGKRYFNYLNAVLILLYLILTVTSFLTIIHSFSLTTVLTFTIHFVLLIYLLHTMVRGTRFWKEFHFQNSPFNELTNEWLFYCVFVLATFLLAVRLISTTVLDGVILSLMDSIYYILFARFIFLYRDYLDKKKKDVDNKGNFDEIKNKIQEKIDDASNAVQDFLDNKKEDQKLSNNQEVKEKDNSEKVVEKKKSTRKKTNHKGDDHVGLLDDMDKGIQNAYHDITEKVKKMDVDQKVKKIGNKLSNEAETASKKIDQFVKEKEIDKKINQVGESFTSTGKNMSKEIDKMFHNENKNEKTGDK